MINPRQFYLPHFSVNYNQNNYIQHENVKNEFSYFPYYPIVNISGIDTENSKEFQNSNISTHKTYFQNYNPKLICNAKEFINSTEITSTSSHFDDTEVEKIFPLNGKNPFFVSTNEIVLTNDITLKEQIKLKLQNEIKGIMNLENKSVDLRKFALNIIKSIMENSIFLA